MAAQPQQSGNDQSSGILWVIVALFIGAVALWYFYGEMLISQILRLSLFEAHYLTPLFPKLQSYINFIHTLDPGELTLKETLAIHAVIENYIRWPLVLCLALFSYKLYKNDLKRQFSKIYSTTTLSKQEAETWPQITPVVPLDLVSTPLDEGAWAMAMTPLAFIEKNQLWMEGSKELDKQLARQCLTNQMGALFTGFEHLDNIHKALCSIFLARIHRDRDGAAIISKQLAKSSVGSLDFTGVNELLNKHKDSPLTQKIIEKHAYVLTLIASFLEAARDDGVLASSEFLWLKPRNRSLWYMLNAVGRQTPFCETAGPFAHWITEKSVQKAIRTPVVDNAVDALKLSLSEISHD